jgi:hypothetical protein
MDGNLGRGGDATGQQQFPWLGVSQPLAVADMADGEFGHGDERHRTTILDQNVISRW